MEKHGEIVDRSEVEPEADTRKGDSYMCHHYGRATCLINFKCCPEEKWYACHKCHNEALGLVENLDEKARENEEPAIKHSDDYCTRVTNIPGEMDDSSNLAETTSEHEDPQHDASTGVQVKRNKNVTGETLDWTSNTEEGSSGESSPMNHTGLHDDPSNSDKVETNEAVTGGTLHEPGNDEEESSEENTSQLPVDATSPSPEENKTKHSVATALDGTRLMCAQCGEKQEISQYCVSCDNYSFATYFCGECKLLIEKKVDPYHCNDCGICRGDKANHFHCRVCNICMALSLKENHKCFADRGHDPCAICFEEVFLGAIIFSCHHMIHKECAEKLLRSGSNLCPMCRNVIVQDDEEAAQQIRSSNRTTFRSTLGLIGKRISGAANTLLNTVYQACKREERTGGETEITNVSTREIRQPEINLTTGARSFIV